MKEHLIDTYLLVLRSRSSAKGKVKYQGHNSQKMAVSGALVFHKHILFYNVFEKAFFVKVIKTWDFVVTRLDVFNTGYVCLKSLPNDKILNVIKLKALAEDKCYENDDFSQ